MKGPIENAAISLLLHSNRPFSSSQKVSPFPRMQARILLNLLLYALYIILIVTLAVVGYLTLIEFAYFSLSAIALSITASLVYIAKPEPIRLAQSIIGLIYSLPFFEVLLTVSWLLLKSFLSTFWPRIGLNALDTYYNSELKRPDYRFSLRIAKLVCLSLLFALLAAILIFTLATGVSPFLRWQFIYVVIGYALVLPFVAVARAIFVAWKTFCLRLCGPKRDLSSLAESLLPFSDQPLMQTSEHLEPESDYSSVVDPFALWPSCDWESFFESDSNIVGLNFWTVFGFLLFLAYSALTVLLVNNSTEPIWPLIAQLVCGLLILPICLMGNLSVLFFRRDKLQDHPLVRSTMILGFLIRT
jgi:hypothetical protein